MQGAASPHTDHPRNAPCTRPTPPTPPAPRGGCLRAWVGAVIMAPGLRRLRVPRAPSGGAVRRDEGRNYRPALLLLHRTGNTLSGQVWICPSPPANRIPHTPAPILPLCLMSGVPLLYSRWVPSQEAPSYGWTQHDGPCHGGRWPHPGQDAGRDGNCVTLSGLGSFLPC